MYLVSSCVSQQLYTIFAQLLSDYEIAHHNMDQIGIQNLLKSSRRLWNSENFGHFKAIKRKMLYS